MKNIVVATLFALLAISTPSCKKMLDATSHRAVTEVNMWQNKNDARSGLSACYGLMRAALANENAYWVHGELRGNDFTVTKREDLKAVTASNLNASFTTMDQWRDWRRFYAAIAQCNTTIEKLPLIPGRDYRYSQNEMNCDRSQAIYIRSFLYYYMVRIWGDVPLVTKAGDGTTTSIAREDWRKVLDFAAQQALSAFDGLPWRYDGSFPEAPGQYRGQGVDHHRSITITKGMVYTLAAHIYAWKGDYPNTLKYANLVVDAKSNTQYDFTNTTDVSRIDGTFRGRNNGNIFQVDMNLDHAEISTTGQLEDWTLREPYIPKRESEIYVSKDSILKIYGEAHEQRLANWFTKMEDVYPMFYKLRQLNSDLATNPLDFYSSAIVIFRYEELFLLRAEARARQGMKDLAQADLNAVRNKRGLRDVKVETDGKDLINAIFLERRRELIGEGWYWYDLVHFNKIAEQTPLTQEEVDKGAALWPISQSALNNNRALIQNSFWK
ncbi:RagB/SusD family nutrient uptake outer membrane protein [Chitinophaga silvatica]|nr:RagB/SusD family nutrient uptake outer membrane protein [Chitinophaga silvatica]